MSKKLLDDYECIKGKWEKLWYVGDKLPLIHERFFDVHELFGNARFVHITRNIVGVASSFDARVEEGSFPPGFTHRKAVDIWNRANEFALAYSEKNPERIVFVDYESILDERSIHKVLKAIDSDLEVDSKVASFCAAMRRVKRKIEEDRRCRAVEDCGRNEFIDKFARFDLYQEVQSRSILGGEKYPDRI